MNSRRQMTVWGMTLALSLAAVSAWAASPLRLVEPRDGSELRVEIDAPATHLVFFATWCPPCVEELGELTRFAERWEERGYRLILVAVSTRQSADKLNAFAGRTDVPGRLLFDAEGGVQRRFAASDLPTHVVLDATGNEVARGAAMDGDVERALADLLSEGRPAGRR